MMTLDRGLLFGPPCMEVKWA